MIQSYKLHKALWAKLVILALFCAAPLWAATLTVTNTNDSLAGSLRDAISVAASGDTIVFGVGVTGTITLTSGELAINKNLTITGPGATSLAISGNLSSRVFEIGCATVAISGLTIQNGSADRGGGGIWNYGGTLTVTNSTLSENSATYGGGGIWNNYGTLTVTNSTVSSNSATVNGGGGIWNFGGTLTVTNSTVSANSAATYGGGIWNFGGTLTLTNSTLSGNTATYYGGGGIFNLGGTLTVTNSTLSGNTADYGGGIGIGIGGTVTVKNTIVSSNAGNNCSGTATSQDHNLSDDGTCASFFTQPGDMNSTPAGLDPGGLKNNGGPTQTIALLPASLAVNAIPVSDCKDVAGNLVTTDQRGVPRPQGSDCDIGAFELGAIAPSTEPIGPIVSAVTASPNSIAINDGTTLTATVTGCPNTDTIGPIVSAVTASPNPVAINAGTTLTANVDDSTTGGSNIFSVGYNIDGDPFIPMTAVTAPFDQVSENVIASVMALAAGLHTVCVRGTDVPGNVGASQCILLVVYDPTGGFVTGGGAVNSPAGADLANTSAAGPATFGFNSKYLPGRSTPDGNLEFQFKAGSLNFKSTSMDWLVVTGEPRAIFRGSGTINGATVCKFEVDAWDGSFPPGNVDAFGLKIFSCAGGGDRYSLAATPLKQGSIIIHK